ncbi:MAG: bifunctional phosphoribosylaminoimidazolecarboxamide formyltransferase/IMP cyclohydrolase [bacterium]|nr:bifunctional phosphoribosylaminoimidazolecarboxamide formyltransferase/IMP cyclohydrolase [bacterium]
MKVKRVLVSVSDKTGLEHFVKELIHMGVEIISTGGTHRFISDLGFKVRDISDFTGFPEILDGRVKTLHPKVHGALLAKRDLDEHVIEVSKHEIEYIDMVVVNLYPFKEMLEKDDVMHEEMIENIDIGGPSMLRSAAKSYESVVVVCDNKDYDMVLQELGKEEGISLEKRAILASKVFIETSAYDNLIHNYLLNNNHGKKLFPNQVNKKLIKNFDLHYGENPHQQAAYYLDDDDKTSINWQQLGGKELSYNNLLDIEAAWNIISDIKRRAVVIVKHNNPCGVGTDLNLASAYKKALLTDPISAYGGIVATNKKVDRVTADEIVKIFTECVVAPDFAEDALKVLLTKNNLRIIKMNGHAEDVLEYKRVFTGFLVQEKDCKDLGERIVASQRKPSEEEQQDLEFSWHVCKHVKSNAIVLAKNGAVLGIGAGQMSRVDSVEIAINKAIKAGFDIHGAVLASDAFFPFKDSIELIAEYGIKAVIQPSGSIRDNEVINSCNEHDIAMIFTGQRHFRH